MAHQSLKERQIKSIERVLNLNHDPPNVDSTVASLASTPLLDDEGNTVWKVLVFDNLAIARQHYIEGTILMQTLGRDMISSVLRVNDLRSSGITVHMHISSTRHPIPDVPVLYLIEPTTDNLEKITADLSKGLYSPAYINFLSSIPRPLLEDFGSQTAIANTSEHIAQVYDQYLNFVVAEPDLFSLSLGRCYEALNSSRTSDEALDTVVDKIVSGLFSVIVTMGVIPIIRCPKGQGAELVATKLDRKLRDHILNSKDNLFSSTSRSASGPSSRPVLIILDRNVDLVPMLSHSWTYQSLVHDVLHMKLNHITFNTPIDESHPEKGSTKQSYDLTSNDYFWLRNASMPFPHVAEDIDAELVKYKNEANDITRKTGMSSLEDLQNETSASAHHLKAAMNLLPELRERKATLDMHMSILGALLNGIKHRQLDNFYQLEENITKQTKAQMLEFLNDTEKGNEPNDKLRLYIMWLISTDQEVNRSDMEKFEDALKTIGADTTSLAYVKQVRSTTRMTMLSTTAPTVTAVQAPTSDLFRGFSSISNRLTDRLAASGITSGVSANFENLISGVKNFLPVNKDLTVTKITESIMDPASASSSAMAKTEGYLYFDPRSANARGTMPPPSAQRRDGGMPGGMSGTGPGMGASFGQRRQGFSEAVVFTVGGGSMDEYGNLQEWAKRTGAGGSGAAQGAGRRRVVYGSTELLNAEEFLKGELTVLGAECG